MMIEKSILLSCSVAEAFALFTERISAWWPPERRHTQDPTSQLFLTEAGRFYERSSAGHEVELGRVLAWQPPGRLLLHWYPGTDAEHPTEVEVRFVAANEGITRVEVTHRPTARSASLWDSRAPRYDQSWQLVLAALARAAGTYTVT
jgi:uncharacterized protein YndB with AHSA1/START domain